MTLFRQLLVYAVVLLTCLCTGLWVGELKRTRDYLIKQLESHAQDTATSLGLSVSTLVTGNDIPAMETMIDAVYDRGYYRLIQMQDIEGNLLVNRQQYLTIAHVPSWFITFVPLKAPTAEALVMEGWQQKGIIRVESHPGYAYQMLWRAAYSAALWFGMTLFAVVVIGSFGLRRLLRPLRQVEAQALALCDRQFHIQETIPRTREFQRVVLAMNKMTARIRAIFNEQSAFAETLLQRTYQDDLTSVGNRRYLEGQIKAKLDSRNLETNGVFALIQIEELQAINRTSGYQAGDQLIKQAASIIQQACHQLPEAVISRLSGGDFALLLPNTSQAEATPLIETILEDLTRETAYSSEHQGAAASGGAVAYDRNVNCDILLKRADTALATARYRNDRKVVIVSLADGEDTFSMGRIQWQELLQQILDNKKVTLFSQPIFNHQDAIQIVRHEILTRMEAPSGKLLSAGMFVPMAERLGLMPALDRIILEQMATHALGNLKPQHVAVNLSPLSLLDENFHAWLLQRLAGFTQLGLRVTFEFPEFRTQRFADVINAFSQSARKLGHGIGIDHFGQGLVHFGYLKSLLPDYVKIDRSITGTLQDEHSDSYFFINTLCGVAHSLDVQVIVEGIEQEEQWRALAKIPLDGVQGFYFRQPEALSERG